MRQKRIAYTFLQVPNSEMEVSPSEETTWKKVVLLYFMEGWQKMSEVGFGPT